LNPVSVMLLALALSLDSFTVGLLYGARGIRLSWGAMLVVSLATGLLLAAAMAGGRLVAAVLAPHLAQRFGAILLTGVGCWVTYQTWRGQRQGGGPPDRAAEPEEASAPPGLQPRIWRVRLGSVGIVIQILREPGAADMDRSGHINLLEAWVLGVALALDSVAAGLGAAMAGFSQVGLPIAAAGGSLALMLIGSRSARFLPFRLEGRWSLLHGLVLVGLGLYRMVI
jgi:putative sporulation protein YtaF